MEFSDLPNELIFMIGEQLIITDEDFREGLVNINTFMCTCKRICDIIRPVYVNQIKIYYDDIKGLFELICKDNSTSIIDECTNLMDGPMSHITISIISDIFGNDIKYWNDNECIEMFKHICTYRNIKPYDLMISMIRKNISNKSLDTFTSIFSKCTLFKELEINYEDGNMIIPDITYDLIIFLLDMYMNPRRIGVHDLFL